MEVLYLATDPLPTLDARWNAGLFRRGDVIAIKPDGWNWGTFERLPPFGRLRVAAVPDDYIFLVQGDPDNGDDSELLRPRAYRLDIALLKNPLSRSDFDATVNRKEPPERDGTVLGTDPVVL